MFLVVGGRGLTGSAVLRQLRLQGLPHDNIQRETRRKFHGRSCDTLVFCAGSSLGWKAAEDPHFDFTASVAHLSYYLHEIRSSRVVLLSDAEVYGPGASVESTREDEPTANAARSTYAYHKLLAEELTRRFAPRHLILRLPTLVGPGLRRNWIFDMTHSSRSLRTAAETKVNVLHTDHMAHCMLELLKDPQCSGTFNLGAKDTVSLEQIADLLACAPTFRPDPGAQPQDHQLDVTRVCERVQLESSEEAVLRFRDELRQSSATA